MSPTDRQSDREVQRTDRGADDGEKWSDVMPFGRADPIPRVNTPKPPTPPHGEAQSCGWGWADRGGCCGDDGHPKWHPDQTLSVSWPFPFIFSVCARLLKKPELPQKRQEEVSQMSNEEPEAVCIFYALYVHQQG